MKLLTTRSTTTAMQKKIRPISPPMIVRNLAWFRANGVTISHWSREHGFSYDVVKELLYGRNKGLRGESHKAAIALGLKPDPMQSQEQQP